MSASTTPPEIDPQLEEWLAEARDDERAGAPIEVDGMLSELEGRIERADASWSFWLKSRATWVRRGLAIVAVGLVVFLTGALTLRADFGELPLGWIVLMIGSLVTLLGASVFFALRPLHRPPLAGWVRAIVIGLTLASTAALALFAPDAGALAQECNLGTVGPCFLYGLLVGLPVYLLLRLLERRARSSLPLITACAAGLTGNLVLQLHCPSTDAEHLMMGHFTVALLFVGGLGVIHTVIQRARG